MKNKIVEIPTSRIEAFSDGVLAIIITVMVFDLKVPEMSGATPKGIDWMLIEEVLPKFISYAFSFTVLAIMWVNHHQLFHQISRSDRNLLWLNVNLLFWTSLVPFSTNFIGTYPDVPFAVSMYGCLFFMNSVSFFLLRHYASGKANLLKTTNLRRTQTARVKGFLGMGLYLCSVVLPFVYMPLAYITILAVPALYFLPEEIMEEEENQESGHICL